MLDGKRKVVASKIQELTKSEMSLWSGLTSLTGVSKSIRLKSGDAPAKSLLGPRKKSTADQDSVADDHELRDIVQAVVVEEVKNQREPIRIRDLQVDIDMDSDEDDDDDSANDDKDVFLSVR